MRILIVLPLLLIGQLFGQIRIKAVGDIMMGSYTPKRILPADSGYTFSRLLYPYFRNADLVFGNLEGPFVTPDMQSVKDGGLEGKTCYAFGMPDYLAPRLKQIGFNMLAINNNHVDDYGHAGYRHTKKTLKGLGLNYSGRDTVTYFWHKGQKYAVAAFKTNCGKYDVNRIHKARELIRKLNRENCIIIVSFHGGAEGAKAGGVENKTEYFLGENRGNVYEFSHALIDEGADLVIGHGPHILRPLELYRGRLIAYSLGNFLTYGNINIKGSLGISVILEVELDRHGKFLKGRAVPMKLRYGGIPIYDKSNRGVDMLQNITRQYFPKTPLNIAKSGEILPKE